MEQNLLDLVIKVVKITPNDSELGSRIRRIMMITDNGEKEVAAEEILEKLNININGNQNGK